MKHFFSRLFLPVLMLGLFAVFTTAEAMPLSEKASINRGMPYYLEVDLTNQYVTAYNSADDTVARRMICSTGKRSGSTPMGTFRLQSSSVYPWFKFETCYIRYGKRITRKIWFHSILYKSRSASSLIWDSFNRLGTAASAGCIRLTPIDAQWISYNCKKGTTVRIGRYARTAETKTYAADLKRDLKSAGHKGIQPTLAPTPRPTLSIGSNNSRVKTLHSRLRSLGFYTGSITTVYTEEYTVPAINAYQDACRAAGITISSNPGEADSALQKRIESKNDVTGRLTTLRSGSKYVAVAALQKRLRTLGYLKSSFKLSTKFGSGTRSAVRAFERMSGIEIPTGIATPALQALIFADAAPTPTPTPMPDYATTTRKTPIYKTKSTGSTRLAWVLSGRQVIVVTSSDGTWTKVRYGSKTGYILSKYLMQRR